MHRPAKRLGAVGACRIKRFNQGGAVAYAGQYATHRFGGQSSGVLKEVAFSFFSDRHIAEHHKTSDGRGIHAFLRYVQKLFLESLHPGRIA